jgi:hypothetical protein
MLACVVGGAIYYLQGQRYVFDITGQQIERELDARIPRSKLVLRDIRIRDGPVRVTMGVGA